MTTELLIIFARHPVWGKVKTRIAAVAGEQQALTIYRQLLLLTRHATAALPFDKCVLFAEGPETSSIWPEPYHTSLQQGRDLGDRMHNAFADAFTQGYLKVVLIGTDCPALAAVHVTAAIGMLDNHDVVIGPANDGGYYLIALNSLQPTLFSNIAWSTASVLDTTIARCRQSGLAVGLLEVLRDVDTVDDLALHPWPDTQMNDGL